MTRVAGQTLVPTGQRKVCLKVVIELPEGPAIGGMTTATVRSQGCLVNIVSSMARITSGFRRSKILA